MEAFIYQGALHCSECGQAIRDRLTAEGHAPADPSAESTYDSDHFPKGPLSDGGGESDTPQHCATCGKFLESTLTADGARYVADALAEAVEAGARTAVLDTWAGHYADVLRQWSKRRRILEAYTALRLWRERWVFTADELDKPARCNCEDRFIAAVPDGGGPDDRSGVLVNRLGECSDYFDDGTFGVPAELKARAADVEDYAVPATEYRNGDPRKSGDAEEWRDVLRTEFGFFARFVPERAHTAD